MEDDRPSSLRRRLKGPAAAGGVYVAAAVLLWFHTWTDPSGQVARGSADVAQNVWWLAWVPHALAHGLDPLFTRSLYSPGGVNVLSNTSFLLPALVLSPVTALFGPVVSFNLAVTLAPALDALALYVVLRRFVRVAPAAFAGGLLFGFGPFIAVDLRYGHLNLTLLFLAPVVLGLLDRIFVRRTGDARRAGAALGLVLVAQFFVSVEMLALLVVVSVAGVVVLAVMGRGRIGDAVPYARRALGAALLVAAPLLVFPAWWFVDGPRHFTGAVWANMNTIATSLQALVVPHAQVTGVGILSGGNGGYLGVPLLALLAWVTLAVRGETIRFAAVMTWLCIVLSLGSDLFVGHAQTSVPMPAWPLLHLPLLASAAASRFAAFVDLFAGMVLALALDRWWAWSRDRAQLSSAGRAGIGAVVAAGVLVLPAMAAPWPYGVTGARQPGVLATTDLRAVTLGALVREYPPVSGSDAANELWQATDDIPFAFRDGYAIIPGRRGRAVETAPPDAVDEVFAAIYLGRIRSPFAASLVASLREHAWDHDAAAIYVLDGHPGSRAMTELLDQAIGPPAVSRPDGAVWVPAVR